MYLAPPLAADRQPPLVATGISTGAVAAAAMRWVYEESVASTPGPGGVAA